MRKYSAIAFVCCAHLITRMNARLLFEGGSYFFEARLIFEGGYYSGCSYYSGCGYYSSKYGSSEDAFSYALYTQLVISHNFALKCCHALIMICICIVSVQKSVNLNVNLVAFLDAFQVLYIKYFLSVQYVQ